MRRLLRPAIAVAVVAVVLRVEPLVGVTAGLACWAVLAWWYPRRAVEGVNVRRSHPRRVFHGEPIEVVLEATNAGRLAVPWMSVVDPVAFDLGTRSTRWVTTLEPGETRTHTTVLEGRRRGFHRLGPGVVGSGDPFGLRRAQGTGVPSTGVLVYPRIVPLDSLRLRAASPMAVLPDRRPLHEDPTRVLGVRDYEPGDPIRKIHWTASAASGSLVVKRLQPGITREVVVALDLTADGHPQPGRRRSAELSVTVAASVVHHLATVERQPAGLRVAGTDAPTGAPLDVTVPPRPDDRHLVEMLEHLARVRLRRDDRRGLLRPEDLGFGTSLLYVGGRVDESRAVELLRLRDLGVATRVVLTGPAPADGVWERTLVERRIPVVRVVGLHGVADL